MSLFHSDLSVVPISRRLENEPGYGYDAEVIYSGSEFKPFYVQFKRPYGYPHDSASSIVLERKKICTVNSDSLYFNLKEHQHNTLYTHLKTIGIKPYVAYVCPLFFDRQEYRTALKNLLSFNILHELRFMRLLNKFPITSEIKISEIIDNDILETFALAPIIHEHICISPHREIGGNHHKYSFFSDGSEIVFHSPEKIEGVGVRLNEWLSDMFKDFEKSEDSISRGKAEKVEQEKREIFHIAEDLNFKIPGFIRDSEKNIDHWLWFGECLRKKYRIYQYGVFRENKKILWQMK